MSWQRQALHVVPLDDLVEHVTDDSDCVCGPETIPVETPHMGLVFVIQHHSLDGREHTEPDHDREDCPLCSARV